MYARAQALLEKTAQRWFCRWRSENLNVNDAPGSSCAIARKVDEIIAKIAQDRHMSGPITDQGLNTFTYGSCLQEEARCFVLFGCICTIWAISIKTRQNQALYRNA